VSGTYEALVAKVNAFSGLVDAQHPGAITCHEGCSQCCHQHLTLLPMEMARVLNALESLSEGDKQDVRRRLIGGRQDPRCPLLDDDGRCRTYDARPMICRTHGLPIEVGQPSRRDVCPLNFPEGPEVDALPASSVLNVERLNVMLGLMDRLAGDGDGSRLDLWDTMCAVLGVDGSRP
jgi:Fe-S-cluster containining protein